MCVYENLVSIAIYEIQTPTMDQSDHSICYSYDLKGESR